MIASAWTTKGNVTFLADKSAIVIAQGGSAELNATTFSSGTIEFDMKSPGGNVGLTFHMRGNTGDALYFRPSADCATSDDCVQYMRIDHGIFEWDLFGDNQARAPFSANTWNHVKLSVKGRSMHVWVNGVPVSAPRGHRLAGAFDSGAIKLHGPASYAHLTITPAAPTDTPERSSSAASGDAHFITRWLAANAFTMPSTFDARLSEKTGIAPSIESLPAAEAFKHVLHADPTGLVNVTAALGESQKGNAIIAAWLKTVVMSEHAQVKHVSIGWTREAWVFVNGKLVYADKNLYGIPAASKTPDGRLSLDNGAFDLPLKKGRNEIDVLLDDNFGAGAQHFGWGLMMRLPDLDGIQLPTK
ncbi:family 16 glycoside hydrolase [Dyella monticola]|nr:family 16 glycoside hydrolase [Dyella monticola]